MKNKTLALVLLGLIIIAQWMVPIQMWQHQKNILKTGKEFKFKTAPIDPNDPFRGKYITLRYAIDLIRLKDSMPWKSGETLYAKIINDSMGFAKIDSIFRHPPKNTMDYVKAKVTSVYNEKEINIEYPFNRYYMEESKAPKAEKLLSQSDINIPSLETFAIVSVKKGEASIKDIIVNDIPIRKYLVENAKNN